MSDRTPSDVQARVSGELAGQTLAAVLRELVPGTSWNRARSWCKDGRASIDGRVEHDAVRRLVAGELIELRAHGPKRRALAARPDDLLFVDRYLVVVRKPAGVLTLPYAEADDDTLVHRVGAALRRREGHGRGHLRIVHRLDKDTSGVLVIARSIASEKALRNAFRHHIVHRRYLAIAHGTVGAAEYESHLVQNRGDRLRGSWGRRPHHRGPPPSHAKWAKTHVWPIESLVGATLVQCQLETGRQHQIRIHLSEAGHPLVGEAVYVREYRGQPIDAPRMMLHAAELGFEHPITGESLAFADDPPSDFAEVLGRLRHPSSS